MFVWVWLKKESLLSTNIGFFAIANDMFGATITQYIRVCYLVGV